MTTDNWDLYDTRHVVYQPQGVALEAPKDGYDWRTPRYNRHQSRPAHA